MKVISWLDENLEEFILMVLCVLMACIMMLQVIMRYAFGSSLSWSEELTRFLFIWSSFLSISYCIRKKLSIKITMLTEALPRMARHIAVIAVEVISFILYAYMVPFAWVYLQRTIENNQLSDAMQIPMWIIYLAPLVGFVLSAIRSMQMTFECIEEMKADTK